MLCILPHTLDLPFTSTKSCLSSFLSTHWNDFWVLPAALIFFSLREYGCGAFVVKLQDAISHPVLQSLGLKVQTVDCILVLSKQTA